MRLHRFYVPEMTGSQTRFNLARLNLVNQIRRVFRLSEGDSVITFNGTGFDYVCKIDGSNGESTIVSDNSIIPLIVTDTVRSRFVPQKKVFLAASLVKKDNFEWITEKAVELGVTDIIPIRADRSEKKSLNEDRLEKITVEASEQCGRGDVPVVHEIMGLMECVAFLNKQDARLLAFHTEGERFPAGRVPPKKETPAKNRPVGVFIGPEGGWSPEEIEMFHSHQVPICSLGSQVLRAETAAIASLSLVMFGAE